MPLQSDSENDLVEDKIWLTSTSNKIKPGNIIGIKSYYKLNKLLRTTCLVIRSNFLGKLNRKNELEQEKMNEEIFDVDLSVGKKLWLKAIKVHSIKWKILRALAND